MRFIRAASVVAGVGVVLAACGGPGTQQQAGGEITFWDTSDATHEAPVFRELIARFEQRHPDITVTYENVPFADAQDNFKTAAQSGSGAPDVLRTEVGWTAEFASLGYLAPLEDTPALQDEDDFLPAPMRSARHEGTVYAVPQVTDALGLLYNKELLAEAGYDAPPETMAEFAEVAAAVGEETDAEGFYLNASDAYYLLPHFYAHGANLLDVDDEEITVNDPAAVAALEQALDLVDSGAAPEPDLADGYTNMQTGFKEGEIAMIFNGPWAMADLREGAAFEDPDTLGVAPIPAGEEGRGGPMGGHNYTAYAGSQNLEAAYTFIRFMASADSQAHVAAELGLLPSRTSVYERSEVRENDTVADFQPVIEQARPGVWIPEGGLLFEPLLQQYSAAVAGEVTAQEALDTVAEEYRTFLPEWE